MKAHAWKGWPKKLNKRIDGRTLLRLKEWQDKFTTLELKLREKIKSWEKRSALKKQKSYKIKFTTLELKTLLAPIGERANKISCTKVHISRGEKVEFLEFGKRFVLTH